MGEFFHDLKQDAKNGEEKRNLLNTFIVGSACLIVSVVNFFTHSVSMAAILGVIAVICFVSIPIYKKLKSFAVISISTLGGIFIMMMYFVVSGENDGFTIVWLLLFPPIGIFFYKLLYGGTFSIILGLFTAIYLWTPLSELGYNYSEMFASRFPIAYFCDTIVCIYINYTLMTYRKQQTMLLEMAQQASNTKSDFLANMSHEIRTPLNAVVGMCELILRENDISDTVRDYCFNIQNSGRSLLSIINDILDFSKIESGKMELIKEEFNIASTINDVINMAITRKDDKPIELIVRCDPDIPTGLIGDELRIRQVIINLVTNAIKFTNSGCVSIRLSQTRHDYGINLSVSVSDTGIGISPEHLENLFSSFQQVNTKKNRSVEGTGLGLAISRKFITSMGGFINVSSVYGSGSEFKFVIPLRVSNPQPFISLKNNKEIKAACFIDMTKFGMPKVAKEYRMLMNELAHSFRSEMDSFNHFDEFSSAASEKNYTHVFVGRQEYLDNREYFDNNSDKYEIVIVQDRVNSIDVPKNMKCIYKPFYALTIASVFNNESVLDDMNERRNSALRFIAPKARVLIVDDNLINLKVAVGLMRPYRMQVLTADSGRAALSLLRSRDIDIVFMDHMMPEMDGVETTKAIRKMDGEYYKKLPIIALTANAVNGVRDMYVEEGLNDFIAKPIELSSLDRILKTWLPRELIKIPSRDEHLSGKTRRKSDVVPSEPREKAMKTELFNSETGISYTGGELEAYLEILDVYIKKADKTRNYILDLFNKKSWKNYIIEVHALKSTSLTIGSKPLSELAKELELAGKAGNYSVIEEKNSALLEMYMKVVEHAKEYRQLISPSPINTADEASETEVTLTAITPEKAMEYIERIKAACNAFDGDGVIAVCDEAAQYSVNSTPLGTLFEDIRNAADDFEYDTAAAKADEICRKLKA